MLRFLVVDDDPSIVRGLTMLLTQDGHGVAPFTSGADAVMALSREPFDAVLTDLEMPHTDGHAVLRAAKECAPGACLVVVSARAPQKRLELIECGACVVADKPMDYDEVLAAVVDCRAHRGRNQGRCPLVASSPLIELRRRSNR